MVYIRPYRAILKFRSAICLLIAKRLRTVLSLIWPQQSRVTWIKWKSFSPVVEVRWDFVILSCEP